MNKMSYKQLKNLNKSKIFNNKNNLIYDEYKRKLKEEAENKINKIIS